MGATMPASVSADTGSSIAAPAGPAASNGTVADLSRTDVASSSAPNANAATRIRVSATDQEAKLVSRVTPVYPPLAVQARIAGAVVLDIVIAKNGKVESVAVVSGHPLLLESAMDAVKQRIYQPTLVNGRAVEVDTRVTVVYSLNR